MDQQAGVVDTAFNILVKIVSSASKVDYSDVNVIDTLHDIIHALVG